MKVLLFVQNGGARPKCVKSFGDRKRNALAYFDAIAKRFGSEGQPERAWLVECDDAEAGRHCIAGGCEPYRCHRADGPMSCRILASGGKR